MACSVLASLQDDSPTTAMLQRNVHAQGLKEPLLIGPFSIQGRSKKI
jgi:hypothetical protein